jgi:hypothetical protein
MIYNLREGENKRLVTHNITAKIQLVSVSIWEAYVSIVTVYVNVYSLLVETANRSFQDGEVGTLVGIFYPASFHHLNNFLVAEIVIDRWPERWFVHLLWTILDVTDDFCL